MINANPVKTNPTDLDWYSEPKSIVKTLSSFY